MVRLQPVVRPQRFPDQRQQDDAYAECRFPHRERIGFYLAVYVDEIEAAADAERRQNRVVPGQRHALFSGSRREANEDDPQGQTEAGRHRLLVEPREAQFKPEVYRPGNGDNGDDRAETERQARDQCGFPALGEQGGAAVAVSSPVGRHGRKSPTAALLSVGGNVTRVEFGIPDPGFGDARSVARAPGTRGVSMSSVSSRPARDRLPCST